MAIPGLPWWLNGIESALAMQGTQVPTLVQEDPTCLGETKATKVLQNYRSPPTLGPVLCNKRSHHQEKTLHNATRE